MSLPAADGFAEKIQKRKENKCWKGLSSNIYAPSNSAPVPTVCRPPFLHQIIPAVKPNIAIKSSLDFVGQNGALAFKVG